MKNKLIKDQKQEIQKRFNEVPKVYKLKKYKGDRYKLNEDVILLFKYFFDLKIIS